MKAERNITAKSEVIDPNIPLQLAGSVPLLAVRLVHAGYLAVITLATLGWLWLIVWIVLQLI